MRLAIATVTANAPPLPMAATASPRGRFTLTDIEADPVGVIEAIAAAHPGLCWTGFGPDPHVVKREGNPKAVFAKARADMVNPWQVGQFVRAAQFLDQAPRRQAVNTSRTSYGWKHVAERWHRHRIATTEGIPLRLVGIWADVYVSNGMLIAAALALDFKVQKVSGCINAYLNLSEHAARGF